MDPGIAKQTQDTLGKIIKKPPLTDKLLGKPPFRFLHDVVTSVIKTTGFMKGLYSDGEMNSENVKEKEAKIAFLQKSIDMVAAVLGQNIAAKPAKIVAGHEPERTNEFLQALAAAISANVDNDEYVKKVLSGGGGGGGGGESKKEESKKEKGEKEEKKERDKDRTRSASRRKDDDKRKKEDKEKSHDREKDKKHRDRSGEEKEKHRDRREKSRDREDRHRDKDKDRERRRKTSDKSARTEDREATHHSTDAVVKGAMVKPHTGSAAHLHRIKEGEVAKTGNMTDGTPTKSERKSELHKPSKASRHQNSSEKKTALSRTSASASVIASVHSQSPLTSQTKLSNDAGVCKSVDKQKAGKSGAGKIVKTSEKAAPQSPAGFAPRPSRTAEAGGAAGSGGRPAHQAAGSGPRPAHQAVGSGSRPALQAVGSGSRPALQAVGSGSRPALQAVGSGSRPAHQAVGLSSSFPSSSSQHQDAQQRKHRDAPPHPSSPTVIKQTSSPTLRLTSGRKASPQTSKASAAAAGTKQGDVSIPTGSPQQGAAPSATKHTKRLSSGSARQSSATSAKSVMKRGVSSHQTHAKSGTKGGVSAQQSASSKRGETQKSATGSVTRTKVGSSSGSKKSLLQLSASGASYTKNRNRAASPVTSVRHDKSGHGDDDDNDDDDDVDGNENHKKKQGDFLSLVNDADFTEDPSSVHQSSRGKAWNDDSAYHVGDDYFYPADSSLSLSPSSPLSDGSPSEARNLLSPRRRQAYDTQTPMDMNDTFLVPGKIPGGAAQVRVIDATPKKREETGGEESEDDGVPLEKNLLVKASPSCYNLPNSNADGDRGVRDEIRPGHKEAEEKENESPEQNGEKESSQDAPSRLQRPTSAKGSRRRRQGREALDDDDEEFQQRESHGPSIGENDLPPQVTAARKMARPPSARPAPPRPKQDGVEAEPAMRLGTGAPTNVIVDDGKQSDDEDENFLVEESAPPPPAPEPVSTQAEAEDDAEHGALVKKMLESKKEAEQQQQPTKKTEIERPALSDAQRRKQRELVSKEIERLQTSIQSLTRSANPLGKIMDYVQEDMDSMQKELDRWRSENKEHALALRRERNVTDRAIEPLKAQLADLDRAISDQLDLIAASKSNIMRSDRRIEKMLHSIARS